MLTCRTRAFMLGLGLGLAVASPVVAHVPAACAR